ncbi:caspase domain-containing protein [Pseudomonas sp. nanlin1]|uniref:caspase family protein n=1 Tax=Pseudomonas sp. nanlin1 TaxID=3040605 RepID=UPI00388E70DC
MRKALFIGINGYQHVSHLSGCDNDAMEMYAVLSRHASGRPNFKGRLLTSAQDKPTKALIEQQLQELFSGDCDTALFYFAGHGAFDDSTEEGRIIGQDACNPSDGIRISDILHWAERAQGIKNKIIILDCCQAGAAADGRGLKAGTSALSEGITILTACKKAEPALECAGQGVFTRLLLQALHGGAANVLGKITPGALYAFVDNALDEWEQRPVFKTNVSRFVSLRDVAPLVPEQTLRKLPKWFPEPDSVFALDPSFEPTDPSHDSIKGEVFAQLQQCNRHSLVEPVQAEHMYFAAMNRSGCRLTALGTYYRELAQKGHF